MPGHFKVAQKSLHGLKFFGAIGAIVSWNFVRTALEMRQNIPLLRASLAAMAAHPLVFGKVKFRNLRPPNPILGCALLLPRQSLRLAAVGSSPMRACHDARCRARALPQCAK